MRRLILTTIFLSGLLLASHSDPAWAQGESPVAAPLVPLTIFTDYPSQVVGIGENVTIKLKLETSTIDKIVELGVKNLPEGWAAEFKGGSHIVQSLFVRPDEESTVDLKLTLPDTVEPGSYAFDVEAVSDRLQATLPLEIEVQEKLPPSLSLDTDLPIVRGKPDGTFRYNATLKNEGDDDLVVDLLAQAPSGFAVSFKSGGQDVTTMPLEANGSKSIAIEVSPLYKVDAADYPVNITAQAGETSAAIALTAEVVGKSDLNLTTPDGRLSGPVQSGKETAISLLLENVGSASAEAINLNATAPTGWTVTFEPDTIAELSPGEQAAITAHVQPADKAITGDYVLSFKAQPKDNTIQTVDYRATVRTSTLWGVGGVLLIAVAVGFVGLAVARFGRR